MADDKLDPDDPNRPLFSLTDKIWIYGAITAVLLVSALAFCAPAAAHGPFSWAMATENPTTGEGCCGPTDCHFVSDYYRRGDHYIVVFEGRLGRFPAKDVQATQDPQGRPVTCERPEDGTLRCLFIPFGS